MVDVNKMNGRMRELQLTNKDVADELGISEAAWYAKKKKGIFNNEEIERLTVLFKLDSPLEIFFVRKSLVT